MQTDFAFINELLMNWLFLSSNGFPSVLVQRARPPKAVWLNGKKLAALKHEPGLAIKRIPIQLIAGDNRLLIKTHNTDQPLNKRMGAIHAALESGRPPTPAKKAGHDPCH